MISIGNVGISETIKTWNWLAINSLLLKSWITRKGTPAEILALNYTLAPLTNSKSNVQIAETSKTNPVLSTSYRISHDAVNRFINTKWGIDILHTTLLRLQDRKETRITKNWVYVLDSTELEKRYAKKMQILKWYKDTTGEKKWIKGYQLFSICCTNGSITYPASFGFKTLWDNKIEMAIKHIGDLLNIGLPIGKMAFDEWFFAFKLLKFLDDKKVKWVSRPKQKRNFFINGVKMKPSEIIREYDEVIAEIIDYKTKAKLKVKIFRVQGKKGWYLLVTNDTEMTKEEALEIYSKRMVIDQPFFRDMKSELDIEGFHTEKFVSFVNHVLFRFLLHILLTVTSIRKGIIQKSIAWIKKQIVNTVGRVIRGRNELRIVLFSDTFPPPI